MRIELYTLVCIQGSKPKYPLYLVCNILVRSNRLGNNSGFLWSTIIGCYVLKNQRFQLNWCVKIQQNSSNFLSYCNLLTDVTVQSNYQTVTIKYKNHNHKIILLYHNTYCKGKKQFCRCILLVRAQTKAMVQCKYQTVITIPIP